MEQRKVTEFLRTRDPLIERRSDNASFHDLWGELTLAQKFSASSLAKYGYELIFIRCSSSGNIAVMSLGDKVTVISNDGDINTTPEIYLR